MTVRKAPKGSGGGAAKKTKGATGAAAKSEQIPANFLDDDDGEEYGGGGGSDDDDGSDEGGMLDDLDDDGEGGLAQYSKKDDKPSGRDALYADPTHDEMKALKETELLFKSSLMQLQITEVKNEATINYSKLSSLEAWLHSLKDTLQSAPAREVPSSTLPQNDHEPAFDSFSFQAPSAMHIVGSFLLHSVTKPRLVVDVAVEMPIESVHHKDFLNHKYLDKRAIFLECLRQQLQESETVESCRYSLLNRDPRKPTLTIKPAKMSGLSGKFSVQIIPVLPEGAFPLARFRPTRNNVRVDGITDISQQPPTPSYNSAIAEDLRMVSHLELLHTAFGDCDAFKETCVLIKVWLRQRSLDSAPDSLNGFTASMILLHLLQQRLISRHMSSYQMLRSFYTLLSHPDSLRKGACLTPSAGKTDASGKEAAFADFATFHAGILLDDTLSVNILSRLTSSSIAELTHEARAALACLARDARDGFTALMLQAVPFASKFDEYVKVKVGDDDAKVQEENSARPGGGSWSNLYGEVAEPGSYPAEALRRACSSIVEKACGDRIYFMRPFAADTSNLFDSLEEAQGAGRAGGGAVTVGMLLNPEHAYVKIDRGPAADDKDAAKAFRSFWGDKSELRRFKDGAILEAIGWDSGAKGEERFTVAGQAAVFALKRHLEGAVDVTRVCGALNGMLREDGVGASDAGVGAFAVLEQLSSLLMGLDQDKLPLRVNTVLPTSTAVRSMSASPITPHPLAYKDSAPASNGSGRIPLSVTAIECSVTLQSSGKWPDDVGAMNRLTCAIYLRMADCLNASADTPCVAHAHEGHLEVLCKGYAFIIRIWNSREAKVLVADGLKRQAAKLEHSLHHRPYHAQCMSSLAHRFPSLPETVRLCKMWMHSSLLSSSLPEEALELIVAHTSDAAYAECITMTEGIKASRPPVLLCTATDQQGMRWTKDAPNSMSLKRVVTLAKAASETLSKSVISGSNGGVRKVMRRSLSEYDAVIHLRTGDALFKACPLLSAGTYKNLRKQEQKNLLVGFRPCTRFVDELRSRYGKLAVFFSDDMAGDVVGVIWAPSPSMGGALTVKDAVSRYPLVLSGAEGANGGDVVPDVVSMLSGIMSVGEGLVAGIEIIDGSRV